MVSSGFLSSGLGKRVVSALVIAPVFIAIMYTGGYLLLALLLAAFAVSVNEWFHLAKKLPNYIPVMAFGVTYMFISYASFYALREVYSLNVLLLFIGMIWFSDIGGYAIGKLVGGPKLIQRISPNKTWSGFCGAILFPAIFSVIWIVFFGLHQDFIDNKWFVLKFIGFILGGVMGCVGQAGDLMVSFVKRQAGVKDTGALIPGHGGLLDRIDSMLLGAPVFLVVLNLLSYVF